MNGGGGGGRGSEGLTELSVRPFHIPVMEPGGEQDLQLAPAAGDAQPGHHKAAGPLVDGHRGRVNALDRHPLAGQQGRAEEVAGQLQPKVGLRLLVVQGAMPEKPEDLEAVETGGLRQAGTLKQKNILIYKYCERKLYVK